ncbi:MAG: SurA N-terminal domain-containing protein [Vicinamibacterales bacterium]
MTKIHVRHTAAAGLTALSLFTACNRQPPSPPPPPVPADAWATVDGGHIVAAEVEKAYQRTREVNATLSNEEVQAAKLSVLDNLITQDLLLAKARELKIDVAQADIEKAFTESKGKLTDEQFQQELSKRSLTADDVRASLRRDLTVQKVLESQVTSRVIITDAEVSDFFNANRERFNLPEDAYHLAQIVVTPVREPQTTNSSGDDATSPQAVQQKVAMLMQRLQMGESFAALAAQFSEDADTAPRGGDLGLVPISAVRQAAPDLRNAVLQMTPGNARVVNQNGASTIVYLVAKQAAGQRDLSTPGVKDQITEALKARREQLLRSAYLTALRTDARITNHAAKRVVEANGKV